MPDIHIQSQSINVLGHVFTIPFLIPSSDYLYELWTRYSDNFEFFFQIKEKHHDLCSDATRIQSKDIFIAMKCNFKVERSFINTKCPYINYLDIRWNPVLLPVRYSAIMKKQIQKFLSQWNYIREPLRSWMFPRTNTDICWTPLKWWTLFT